MPLTYGVIRDARSDNGSPLKRTVTGYGKKVPTRYRVRLANDAPTGRWRRVYMRAYGNVPSFFVIVDGEDVILRDADLDMALTAA
jgi:hypothetical protein